MAARSPSSPLPPPPGRQSGRGSPRPVHGGRSEASGLADAAREALAAKSDLVWRGEEGTGDRRGPGLAGAAVAPVASAPPGSWQPEGLSVVEAKATRMQLLEEELSSLKEELALCQADKEFVWSLWKRLQAANPDLTQTVRLVVEREKQKSEVKDRKVLEILQVKDVKIQELEQTESELRQEINDLVKWKAMVDEENAFLRKEFSDLQKKCKDKSQELKDTKEFVQNKEEQSRLFIKNLEEENEKLRTRCTDLLNDLEKLRNQEAYWRKEKHSADAKVKAFEDNLIEAKKEIELLQSKYNALSLQLNNKQTELLQKDMDITLVRKELQELQNLYKQNSAHTAQQAELIQQLQVLNMDTQKVLKNQEDVHTAESISYQKLYNELHICFETTKSNEAVLRQSVVNLQDQLFQKEQENIKLKEQLKGSQGEPCSSTPESESHHSAKSQENDELRDAHEKRKERLQMLHTNYRAVKEQLKQWEEDSGIRTETRKMKRAHPQQLQQEDSDAVWNELAYFKRENRELMVQKMNLQDELDELKVHMSIDKTTIQELNRCMAEKREEQLFRHHEDAGVKKSTPEKNEKAIPEQTLQKVIELENRLKSFEQKSRKLKEGNKKLKKENDFLKSHLKHYQEDSEVREKELEHLLKVSKDVENDKGELQVKITELEREVTTLRRQVAEAKALRNDSEEAVSPGEKCHHPTDKAKSEVATREVRARPCDCKTTTTKVKFKAAKKKISVGRHHTLLNHSIKVMSHVENLSKDGWEDVSEGSSDSETRMSQNLGTIIVETSQKISPIEDGEDRKEIDQTEDSYAQQREMQTCSHEDGRALKDMSHYKNTKKMAFQKKSGSTQKSLHAVVPARVNREKCKNIPAQKSSSNTILLRERIISLQQQNSLLHNARKAAESSAKEYKEANEKLLHQQQVSEQRFQTSRQTIKKLTLDLAGLRKEKEDLLKKLESSSDITSLAEEVSRVIAPQIRVTTLGPSRSMDLEMKQLQCKLKNATNELTKQSSNVKSLKLELLAKEDHIKEMHEKTSRMERDITMKRHLIEDLKFRQKVNSENNESFNEMLESLEKKVKTLTEECSNKKISVDSLKQRLNVAMKEKSQYEQMYQKTKEDLDKKELKLSLLISKLNETETAMAQIETAAADQLQSLALQSEQALEGAQKKLLAASETLEEFTTFVKALVKELQSDVHRTRHQIRELKKMQRNRHACKTSTHKAQTLAASILNISRSDLEEILDTEDEVEIEKTKIDAENDKEWLLYIQKLLEGQLPFASYLLEAILEKISENKKLTEGYFTLMKDFR
ncbi:centlein isoform X6 [Alexandromys fortis]|uniref:centlein isoform X6 n=1 Tax=Alexandromys fortis TaxID=100897 RepID=UPI00215272D7|nr:centlein isoform X6 [Microtus fortis]